MLYSQCKMKIVMLLLLATLSLHHTHAVTFGNNITWEFLENIDPFVTQLSTDKLERESKKICVSFTECDYNALEIKGYTWESCHQRGCYCDFLCHSTSTCCMHKPYSFLNVECVPIIYDKTVDKQTRYGLLVSGCLTESHEFASKCADDKLLIPVTSQTSGITYRNKFCALCHNDMDLLHWSGSLSCKDEVTSWFEGLRSGLCTVSFPLSFYSNVKYCSPQNTQAIVNTCNTTGLWQTFDSDINWACEHLNQRFLQFKNIFCYICNPSLITVSGLVESPLDECDDTRMVSTYTNDTHSLCDIYTVSQRLYPYKNIYCKHCRNDRVLGSETFQVMRNDLNRSNKSLIITFTVEAGRDISSTIGNLQNMLTSLNERFQDDVAQGTTRDMDAVVSQHFSFRNISEFQKGIISLCGEQNICQPYFDETNSSIINSRLSWPTGHSRYQYCEACSCEANCIFTTVLGQSCCMDKLLTTQPYGCLNESFLPILADGEGHTDPKTTIRVINKCLNPEFTDVAIKDKCTYVATNDLELIPVGGEDANGVYFKNIYCMLCNTNATEFKIYLKMTCGNFLEFDILESLDMFFSVAKQHKCSVRFTLPTSVANVCDSFETESKSQLYDTRCFKDGQWSEYEKLKQQLTASGNPCHGQNDSCSAAYYTPFPSLWLFITSCQMCDNKVMTRAHGTIAMGNGPSARPMFCTIVPEDIDSPDFDVCAYCERDYGYQVSFVNYRTMFAVSGDMFEEMLYSGTSQQTCNSWIDPVSGQCVHLRCKEGRVIVDGVCVYPDDSVSEIYYKLAMIYTLNETASCSSAVSSTSTTNVMQTLCWRILVIMGASLRDHSNRKLLQCDAFMFNESTIDHASVGEYSDRDNFIDDDQNCCSDCLRGVHIYTVVWYFVHSTEVRTLAENSLLELTKINIEITDMVFDRVPYFVVPDSVPILCSKQVRVRAWLAFPEQDIIRDVSYCVGLDIEVQAVVLNKSQVILTLSNFSEHISLPLSSVVIPNNVTELMSSEQPKSVFVCEDEYRQATKHFKRHPSSSNRRVVKDSTPLAYAYRLFSSICSILSLIALFLTLTTYSLFPILRTVPGRNNMNLAACMFVTQIFFEAQALFNFPPYTRQCLVVGVFLHFFWLGTFCAMCICCYHMFRLFVSLTNALESDASLNRKYILIVLLAPLSVIGLVLIANVIGSSGSHVGYGSPRCFLDNLYSMLFGFVGPSLISFLLNIVFFAVTFYKISRAPKLQKNKDNRRDLVIYVKLCTITGVTWPMLFIDSFFDLSVFSFVATFFNALQGFFIFLAFVCNERVFGLYKQLCGGQTSDSTMVSGKTSKTVTSYADTSVERAKENKND